MNSPVVLYEDNHLLVVVKGAGDLAQGDRTGDESLLEICREYVRVKYGKPGNVFMGLVHRLDRPVSGVMVFARTSKAASRLSEQFRSRSVKKFYLAVVEGEPKNGSGLLEDYLSGGKFRLKTSVSSEKTDGAKKARLKYNVLRHYSGRSLLEVELLTGYKHQIRVQLAAMGCPVVGDFKYDRRQNPAVVEKLFDGRAIALHASRLEIFHPTTKERMVFSAPLPSYWPLSID